MPLGILFKVVFGPEAAIEGASIALCDGAIVGVSVTDVIFESASSYPLKSICILWQKTWLGYPLLQQFIIKIQTDGFKTALCATSHTWEVLMDAPELTLPDLTLLLALMHKMATVSFEVL